MANRDEHAIDGDFFGGVTIKLFQTRTCHARGIAQHFIEYLIGFQSDFALSDQFHHAIDQNWLGAERITTMNQSHMAGDVRQIQGFFNRGIAAADHRNGFATVEKTIARRTCRHTASSKSFF